MKIKLYSFISFIILSGCTTLENNPNYTGHPIIGRWNFEIDGCIETYNFRENGIRDGVSYKETFRSEYRVSIDPLNSGLYTLYDKVLEENNEQDCSGSTENMTGDEVDVFVLFLDGNKRLYICYTENENNCFGPFIKQ